MHLMLCIIYPVASHREFEDKFKSVSLILSTGICTLDGIEDHNLIIKLNDYDKTKVILTGIHVDTNKTEEIGYVI